MSRIYVVPFTAVITNAGGNVDLWELLPATQQTIRIRGIRLGQITEVQDAAEEGLEITIKRLLATVTSGSGGVAGAPEETTRSGQAPAFASETNNATVATSSGATEILDEIGWNNRNTPYEMWFPDREFAPACQNAEGLVVRLETTLADDMTFAGNIWVEEGP